MIGEPQADLKRLERREWLRWAVALLICGILTIAICSFSLPALRRSFSEQAELETAIGSLIAIVLIFAVFTAYQQIRIVGLRRELLTRAGMRAALDLLQPPCAEDEAGREQTRQFPRFHFDALLKLTAVINDKERVIYGRVSDLSEGGLGAVISDSLPRRHSVKLEFELVDGKKISVDAVVLHQRGFHHGFMYLDISAEDRAAIRGACVGAPAFAPWQPTAHQPATVIP